MMDYSESSYFDGFAFQHIADYFENLRLKAIAAQFVKHSQSNCGRSNRRQFERKV